MPTTLFIKKFAIALPFKLGNIKCFILVKVTTIKVRVISKLFVKVVSKRNMTLSPVGERS